MTERVPVPLAIHHSPMCLTFAFFGDECVRARISKSSRGLRTLTMLPLCSLFSRLCPSPTRPLHHDPGAPPSDERTHARSPHKPTTHARRSLAVLDPSHLESQLCTGTLTLALNSQSEICVLSKQGGAPLGADEVMRAVGVGVERVREVDERVVRALADEKRRRVVEVR